MKVKAILSIGYPGATQEEEIEIDDSKLKGLTSSQKEDHILKEVDEWAEQYIETYYEEPDEA